MDKARCSGCKQPILWVKTLQGRNMPVDPEPSKRIVVKTVDGYERATVHDTYMPHWATCPNAEQFRNREKD